MDPASVMLLFVLFQATEKVISYAGGKVADSVTKPLWEALEGKAKWLAGKDDTSKRWEAFSKAFTEARIKLEREGRHPEVAKQVAHVLGNFTVVDSADKEWLNDLSSQFEKASLVSEKPDEFLLVELFSKVFSKQNMQFSRAELSETVSDFVAVFQDRIFAQVVYQEEMFKRAQWQALRQSHYDTRERYISQVIDHNENLDFVGIPELKDRQALRIEDVFISLQTQVEESKDDKLQELTKEVQERNIRAHLGELKPKVSRRLSVNQALTENQKIVVLGDPGSGKTTLLKYIVLAYAENKADKIGVDETRLPIFIRLYDYVAKREECGKDGFSFTDYLNKYCTDNLQLHLAPDFFEHALERGECCVCFDGLDELGAAGLRREITLAVAALANRYSRNRFIVTSRIVGYEEAPLDKKEFVHHTVQPLSDDDIRLFVEKWYKAREKDAVVRRERTNHLIKTIMNEPRIKSLASNPLMLTIIALVHRIEAELPHERVKLYDKCITTLVETWDKVRGMKTTLRRRLLEKIAYWMHTQPGERGRTREVREGTLRLQLLQFLQSDPKLQLDDDQIHKEVDDFIVLVKTRSGLLVERGEDIYTFSHLTFQEYLAARDIEKRCLTTDEIWNEIQPRLHDAHWREVILLLLGSLNSHDYHNSILVRKIFNREDMYEPVLRRHLLLSAQALSDHVEVESALHNQIVDALLALAASDELASSESFTSLASLQNNSRAGDGLLALARDERADADMRSSAAQALGQLGRADEASRLLLALVEDEKVDAYLYSSAAQALGQLGRADEASKLLLAQARDERADADMRGSAARALGQLGRADEAVLNGLLALASDEKADAYARYVAAQALGQLGRADEAVLNGLLALAGDKNVQATVRLSAAEALGRLGYADEAVLNGLLALASDEKADEYVRSSAAEALGQLGRTNEAVLNGMLALASDEKAINHVRSSAAQALGQLGRADEASRLLLALADDEKVEAYVRSSAAQALGQLGRADEASRLLLALADDEKVDVYVRRSTAEALGQLGRVDEASRLLLALASDEKVEAYARSGAARALGQLGRADEAVLNKLLALASDEKADANLRYDAAQALGRLGHADEAVLNGLLALTEKKKKGVLVRYGAYDALKRLLG